MRHCTPAHTQSDSGTSVQKEELEKETYRLKHELVSTQMKLEAMRAELEKYKALETLEHSRGKEAEKEEQARK